MTSFNGMIGFILVDKPEGRSSASIVGEVRRRLGGVKAGHAGTLDPMATGLLICVLEGATRLASYAQAGRKTYLAKIKFGLSTSTDDITGDTLETSDVYPTREYLEKALPGFLGKFLQQPPQVSARKVEGKRAYALARAGESFELKPSEVECFAIELIDFQDNEAIVRVQTSAGFYVRSLARDLGERCGTLATLSALRREQIGAFSVETAIAPEAVDEMAVRPWQELLGQAPTLDVSEDIAKRLLNGDRYALAAIARDADTKRPDGQILIYTSGGTALGLLRKEADEWKIAHNFVDQQT